MTMRSSRFLLLGLVLLVGTHLWLIDGLDGAALASLSVEDTEFAPGYSDMDWRRVRVGMTEARVHELLGPPLRTRSIDGKPGSESQAWSRSPGSNDYRCRTLIFENGRVLRKHSEYYID